MLRQRGLEELVGDARRIADPALPQFEQRQVKSGLGHEHRRGDLGGALEVPARLVEAAEGGHRLAQGVLRRGLPGCVPCPLEQPVRA